MVASLDLRLRRDAERKGLMKRFMYTQISANPYNDPPMAMPHADRLKPDNVNGNPNRRVFPQSGARNNIILCPTGSNNPIHFHLR